MLTPNMTWQEYCDIRKMNASLIVKMNESPLAMKTAMEEGFSEPTKEMQLGTGVHALLLEPNEFDKRFCILPDFRNHPDNKTQDGERSYRKTKVSDDMEKKFLQGETRNILTNADYEKCKRAISRIHSRPVMRELLSKSNNEVTVEGIIDDVPFKGRIDFLTPQYIGDLKTARCIDKRRFGYAFMDLHYGQRMAIYRELVRQQTNTTRECVIICQKVSGDFDNCLVKIPSEELDEAFDQVRTLIAKFKACMSSNVWPGVDGGADWYELELPKRYNDEINWGEIPTEETEEVEAYF